MKVTLTVKGDEISVAADEIKTDGGFIKIINPQILRKKEAVSELWVAIAKVDMVEIIK